MYCKKFNARLKSSYSLALRYNHWLGIPWWTPDVAKSSAFRQQYWNDGKMLMYYKKKQCCLYCLKKYKMSTCTFCFNFIPFTSYTSENFHILKCKSKCYFLVSKRLQVTAPTWCLYHKIFNCILRPSKSEVYLWFIKMALIIVSVTSNM